MSSSFIPSTGLGSARICLAAAAAAPVVVMVESRAAAAGVEPATEVRSGWRGWTSTGSETAGLRRRSGSGWGGVQKARVWRAPDSTVRSLISSDRMLNHHGQVTASTVKFVRRYMCDTTKYKVIFEGVVSKPNVLRHSYPSQRAESSGVKSRLERRKELHKAVGDDRRRRS